jgi:hypothetical protein
MTWLAASFSVAVRWAHPINQHFEAGVVRTIPTPHSPHYPCFEVMTGAALKVFCQLQLGPIAACSCLTQKGLARCPLSCRNGAYRDVAPRVYNYLQDGCSSPRATHHLQTGEGPAGSRLHMLVPSFATLGWKPDLACPTHLTCIFGSSSGCCPAGVQVRDS